MQVQNADVWEAPKELALLLEEVWPVKTAYWLAKLARKISEHHNVLNDVRVKLIRQYGQADDKGNIEVKQGTPGWESFSKEFNELLAEDTELTGIDNKIVLPSSNGLHIKGATLFKLYAFIAIPDEEIEKAAEEIAAEVA